MGEVPYALRIVPLPLLLLIVKVFGVLKVGVVEGEEGRRWGGNGMVV
jgi:hypothetical protein